MLNSCDIPEDILSCKNSSYSNLSGARPGWNGFVKSFQSETLDWHSIWISSGRQHSGFVCDMRRSSRKAYHKQVDFVLKRESKMKGVKIAERFFL